MLGSLGACLLKDRSSWGIEQRSRPRSQLCLPSQESLSLRNHIALRAILSALQRPAIHRLHSTWGHVSWWVGLSPGPGHLSGQGRPYVWQCPSVGWDFLGGGRA